MKIANGLVAIAVTAVAMGTMAYGQTEVLQAKIPFAFHTMWGTMPAGPYDVARDYAGTRGVIYVKNTASSKGFVIMGISNDAPSSDATNLRFRCDDGCELVGVRSRNSLITLPWHKKAGGRETAVIEVPVTVVSGN